MRYCVQSKLRLVTSEEGTLEPQEEQAKRPNLVWAITIFYAITAALDLLTFFPPATKANIVSFTALGYSLTTLVAVLTMAGALSHSGKFRENSIAVSD